MPDAAFDIGAVLASTTPAEFTRLIHGAVLAGLNPE
jgi:hypothetical protein